jgi:hypothetical protein
MKLFHNSDGKGTQLNTFYQAKVSITLIQSQIRTQQKKDNYIQISLLTIEAKTLNNCKSNFKTHLKIIPQSTRFHSRDARLFQHIQFNKSNTAHK